MTRLPSHSRLVRKLQDALGDQLCVALDDTSVAEIMKLMALVMISRIGSEVLIGLANEPQVGDQFQTALAIAGIAVVVFIIAIYVPTIIQGVVQGASVSGGMTCCTDAFQRNALFGLPIATPFGLLRKSTS